MQSAGRSGSMTIMPNSAIELHDSVITGIRRDGAAHVVIDVGANVHVGTRVSCLSPRAREPHR